MRKLVVAEGLTLDGVMQAPGDPDEDRSGGFDHGGWQMPYFDEVAGEAVGKSMAETGAFLFGRRTYEIMAAHWPNVPEGDMFADVLNGMPKYVASTTLQEPLSWANSNLLGQDVPTSIKELKEEDGGTIVVLGSGNLVQTLIEHDLVDEYALMIHPLVLGTGKKLFEDGLDKLSLRLLDSMTTTTGVVFASYAPEGR
ncbi:MAG TPA: dihydrofolate reductase family protein [Acidimicrobiia bacterium]|nr:dihydrofolate reductase family protein [Acidimicrobiia bacterium]